MSTSTYRGWLEFVKSSTSAICQAPMPASITTDFSPLITT
jgi:hypothetical protein